MSCSVLREEFRARNLLYEHPDKTAFYRCMWKWPRPVWLAVRLVLALYMIFGFTYELYNYYTTAKNYGASGDGGDDVSANSTTPQQQQQLLGGGGATTTTVNRTAAVAGDALATTVAWSFGRLVNEEATTTATPAAAASTGWDTRRPWWVFFTLWTYTVLLLHMVLAAVLSVVFTRSSTCHETYELGTRSGRHNAAFDDLQEKPHHVMPQPVRVAMETAEKPAAAGPPLPRQRRLPWYFKLSWLLSDIITTSAPIVSIVFFAALYSGGPLDIYNTNTHLLNAVFVAVDQLVSARPVRLLHVLAPVVFGLVYNVFNLVFWTFDHVQHVLYPGVIDWNHPLDTVGSILGMLLVMTPLIHLFWFGVYRAKLWLYARIYNA